MKIIIFDIDGTLFDTKPGIVACLNDVLDSFGLEPIDEEEHDKYIGPSVKDSFIKYHNFNEIKANEATRMYREKYVSNYIEKSIMYDGLIDVIKYIKFKKYKLCIATMKTRKQVNKLLNIFKLSELFDQIETAKEEGGYTKTDMLNSIKRKYTDSEYFFIGDTDGDYKAALNSGIEFIYATYGYGKIDGKANVIGSLRDMINLLQEREKDE